MDNREKTSVSMIKRKYICHFFEKISFLTQVLQERTRPKWGPASFLADFVPGVKDHSNFSVLFWDFIFALYFGIG